MLHPDIQYDIICASRREQLQAIQMEQSIRSVNPKPRLLTSLFTYTGDWLIILGTWLKQQVNPQNLAPTEAISGGTIF